ncbi:hypothetical protein [Aeromicrobium sp. UC242_57]|uniref:hypothetical protein n=1 Tax=Aeromicrobium sp. UC242_57 TaxID=3374624 RepID=UPI0037A49560
MLRVFLGEEGLRDLHLPSRLPWAVVLILPANLVRYQPSGARRGASATCNVAALRPATGSMRRYFGTDVPQIGRISQD